MSVRSVNYRGNIVIDYIKNSKNLRYPTGITKIPQNPEFFKHGKLTHKIDNFRKLNTDIDNLITRIKTIINNYNKENDADPPVSFIRSKLNEHEDQLVKRYEYAIGYFKDFLIEIKSSPIKPNTNKDFNSCYNSLHLYDYMFGKQTAENYNSVKFIEKFEKFLSNEHKNLPAEYKTRGGLNDNTIKKRVKILKRFLSYLETNGILKVSPEIVKYKSKLKRYSHTIVTLDKSEIEKLAKLELTNKKFDQIRDLFLMLIMTGLRYSDLMTLKKEHVNDVTIEKFAIKTNDLCSIPLTKTAKRILTKYNYELPKYSLQKFNEYVKDLMEEYEVTKGNVLTIRKSYNKIEEKSVPKHSVIESHTGRRTFISRCVQEKINIKEIMRYTGHKKLDTLVRYIDVFGNHDNEQIQMIDFDNN